MTQQEILEYNKRCAEFLGAKLGKGGTLKNPCYVNVPIAHGNIIQTWTILLKEMKFHSDWNWIKSVLEKISSLNEDDFSDETQQAFENLLDLSLFSSKESVCESINNFIKTIN